ncbi:hypothetical protein [Longimicrobium sp.]|uniref:hypothetical protein n=1 Tax=Longimicrobium sp. TaxID=2029185 RepID=UPI002E2FAAE3|nr:hypothetical protein [Longimicrobium sp.]HEX6042481.1 hypothetical protein [Longimicrobium sp.]
MSEMETAVAAEPVAGAETATPDLSAADPGVSPAEPVSEGATDETVQGRSGEEPGARQSLKVGSAVDTTIKQAETLIESLHVAVAQQTRQAVRLFTCAEGRSLTQAQEEASAPRILSSETEIDELVTYLEERRVLLLVGDRGARKVSTAVFLGMRLRQRGSCRASTVLVSSLDRQVRIDAQHLAEKDPLVNGRLVIFRRPFGRADRALAKLLEETDRSGWEQLEDALREQRAYVVFTADPDDARRFHKHPAAGEHARELRPHPRALREAELERKLESVAGGDAQPGLVAALSAGRDVLLSSFRHAPSLLEFIDFYVDQGRPELELGEAVARFNDTSTWLLQELEDDFEGWSFAFTLVLAHAVRGAQGVPWMDFDRLHRRVRQWLRRDMNQRAPSAAWDTADDASELHPAFSEATLLKRCRAEVVKDPGTLVDVIRFQDGTPADRLWNVLLARHRRALTTVLPGLRDMAESGEADLRSLRVLAAQVIGRIGEVDPHRVVLPTMERWVHAPDQRHLMAVGALCEGVLGSEREEYRRVCLRKLREAEAAPAPRDAAAEQWLMAAIGAYSWIGDHELDAAMDALEAIARRHLIPMIGDLQEFAREIDDVELALKDSESGDGSDPLRLWHAVLRAMMAHIYQKDAKILMAVQRSLVSLCLTAGPIPVFVELRRWIGNTGWKMGVLVALMFLHDRGIARRLKQSRVDVGAGMDGARVSCNPLVLWIAAGEDEVKETAAFLGAIYKSLKTPFAVDVRLHRSFEESLQGHLLDWVRDALPVPEYVESMRMLFRALVQTHGGVLRPPLDDLLSRREFRQADDYRLREFAASVQA